MRRRPLTNYTMNDKQPSTQLNEKDDIGLLDSLVEMEQKVDQLILTKRLEMQEWISASTRVQCKIRVTVTTSFTIPSNYTLPNFQLPVSKDLLLSKNVNLGRMEIKIEGKIIEALMLPDNMENDIKKSVSSADLSKYNKSFTSYFRSIFVELDPQIYGHDLRSLEWIRTNNVAENEGFVFRRPLVTKNNINVTFYFRENSTPSKFQLSFPLQKLLGVSSQTKSQVFLLFYQFLKINNLLDPCQPSIINCNSTLRALFQLDNFNYADIPSLLIPHLSPLPPHCVTVEIENPLAKIGFQGGTFSSTPQNFEIITEVSDFFNNFSSPFIVEYDDQVLDMNTMEIQSLEKKSKSLSEYIASTKTRIREYNSYVKNPLVYMVQWINNNCKDKSTSYNTLAENKFSPTEEEKSAEYYNRPFVQECVHRYIYNLVENKNNQMKTHP